MSLSVEVKISNVNYLRCIKILDNEGAYRQYGDDAELKLFNIKQRHISLVSGIDKRCCKGVEQAKIFIDRLINTWPSQEAPTIRARHGTNHIDPIPVSSIAMRLQQNWPQRCPVVGFGRNPEHTPSGQAARAYSTALRFVSPARPA